jgi:hypothetical protein
MAFVEPPPLQIAEVYIDESSTRHRYLVLGGIITLRDNADAITGFLLKARLPELPHGEMKWIKVSTGKLQAYMRFVDVFFRQPRGTIDFHSIIVDTTKQKHAIFNQGSREIGFNKEIYQLVMKCGRIYNTLFHIYPDYRDTNQRPEELRLILNRGARKTGDKRDWPYRRLQFRDSKATILLQLADILSGALAYHLNGHRLVQNASPAKCTLSDHILQSAGIQNVFRGTPIRGKFTVWHRQLR